MKGKVIVVDFSAKRKKKNSHDSFWTRLTNALKNLFSTNNKYNKLSKGEKYRHKNIY